MNLIDELVNFLNKNDANPEDVNANFDEIRSTVNSNLNGGLKDENLAEDANISPSKLNQGEGSGLVADTVSNNGLKQVYPVGSIYTNASDSTNPATLLGFGTWERFGEGRVVVGVDSTDTDFDTVEKTGGEKTHTLTDAEMPSHNHTGATSTDGSHNHTYSKSSSAGNGLDGTNGSADGGTGTTSTNGSHSHSLNINSTGGSNAHNNLQPYITVYMWKRVA